MNTKRPFRLLENLFKTADTVWFSLEPADHLEAFAAHPRIGSAHAGRNQGLVSAQWSSGEQSQVISAETNLLNELSRVNRLYEKKFGFIFIVCATGKSADEMLTLCESRLGNAIETEMRIAAVEQWKITELRLHKLLEK